MGKDVGIVEGAAGGGTERGVGAYDAVGVTGAHEGFHALVGKHMPREKGGQSLAPLPAPGLPRSVLAPTRGT